NEGGVDRADIMPEVRRLARPLEAVELPRCSGRLNGEGIVPWAKRRLLSGRHPRGQIHAQLRSLSEEGTALGPLFEREQPVLQPSGFGSGQFKVHPLRFFALPALWHRRNKKLPKPFIADRVIQALVDAFAHASDGRSAPAMKQARPILSHTAPIEAP